MRPSGLDDAITDKLVQSRIAGYASESRKVMRGAAGAASGESCKAVGDAKDNEWAT